MKEINYTGIDTDFTFTFLSGRIITEDTFLSRNALKYILVKGGKRNCLINGEKVELICGDLLFLREGDTIQSIAGNQPFEAYGVSFLKTHLESACEYMGSNIKEKLLYSKTFHRLHLTGYQFDDIVKKHDLLQIIRSQKDNLNIKLKVLLIQILTLFLTAETGEGETSMAKLYALYNKMNNLENLEEGLPAMLRFTGFSHGHLCRIMKDTLGVTPLKYLTDMRMEYASKLLINSDIDIFSISLMLGYTSLSYFITLFGKNFGLSPSRYRQYRRKSGVQKVSAIT